MHREKRNLTQEALAFDVGIHPNALGRCERGETDCRVMTLFNIADGLNASLAELIAGAERRL